ncbi:MAG: hypothetical protein JWL75_155 [Parcubacteria group bacterium]|nr:hypothetical protein [Parcubacteria group bacterium]
MIQHKGKRLCITGMPTAGKSTLARRLIDTLRGTAIHLDDFREELRTDERYAKWAKFYLDQDLETYYTTTTPEDEWKNLVAQSEAIWPAFLEYMDSFAEETGLVVFDCVNLLPHLVTADTEFPCIVLIGTSYEETLERNKKDPRWGSTEKELELNTKSFFYVERPRYLEEAKKYNCPVFETSDQAYPTALELLQ